MLIRRCEPPTSGRRSRRRSTRIGPRCNSRSRTKDRPPRPPPSSRPCSPCGWASEFRFHATRSDGGAERARNIAPTPRSQARLGNAPARRCLDPRAGRGHRWRRAHSRRNRSRRSGTISSRRFLPTGATSWRSSSVDSSDHVPRAALLGAPMNPTRVPGATALRFRVSGKQGYGVAPQMARRCFERMDAEGITGRITVVYDLSDSENDVTQGPVWRVAGGARSNCARLVRSANADAFTDLRAIAEGVRSRGSAPLLRPDDPRGALHLSQRAGRRGSAASRPWRASPSTSACRGRRAASSRGCSQAPTRWALWICERSRTTTRVRPGSHRLDRLARRRLQRDRETRP